jgi:hypothetical protein
VKRILLASLGGLLALSACIIESDDDDTGTTTTTTTSAGGTTGVGGDGGTTGVGGDGGAGVGGNTPDCLDSEDCDANNTMVCDPQSLTCETAQCDETTFCTAGELCLDQGDETNSIGACYTECTPFGGGCGAGQDCIDLTGAGTLGACFNDGAAGFHESCSFHDTSDGCGPGLMCFDDGVAGECIELCNYWGSDASCTDPSEHCVYQGVCFNPGFFDPAAVGQACGNNAAEGDWCAPVGDELQGVCLDTGTLECLKLCRIGEDDCNPSETCEVADEGDQVGVCL